MKSFRKGGMGEREKGSGSFVFAMLVGFVVLFSGCSYYSFTGATIPAQYNTIAIPLAEDQSVGPLPTLDDELTERLIDRFVRQTRLSLETEEAEADVVLLARIERYTNVPTAVTGEERAQQNRVTIAVHARYIDQRTEEALVERTFSSFEQYDPLIDGIQGEEAAALAALDDIADDIFTAATSNW